MPERLVELQALEYDLGLLRSVVLTSRFSVMWLGRIPDRDSALGEAEKNASDRLRSVSKLVCDPTYSVWT